MIKLEDIRIGEKYNLTLLAIHRSEHGVILESPTGVFYTIGSEDLEALTPAAAQPAQEKPTFHINDIYDLDTEEIIGYEVAHGDTSISAFYTNQTYRTLKQALNAAIKERDTLNKEHQTFPRKYTLSPLTEQ